MLKSASAALMGDFNVQYDCLEQSRAQLSMRLHAFLSAELSNCVFDNAALMQGKNYDIAKYHRFLRDMKRKINGRFHVSDTRRGKVSPMHIASQIERNKPDIVFIDYITLLEKMGDGDYRSIGKLSEELKQIATEYQIPIVVAAQMNRAAGLPGKEPPGTESIAGADAIGNDADGVVTMRRKSKSVQQMKMAKYRDGQDGYSIYCEFRPSKGIYKEVTYDRAMDIMDEDKDEDDAK
jgi:replicative DNA helicase